MSAKQKDRTRAQWLAAFESIVIAALPGLAGRIPWDDAIHLFNLGMTAPNAAARFIASHKESNDAS